MKDYKEKNVALVGSGLIGSGWAIHFLYHGIRNLRLYDPSEQSLHRAKQRIEEGLQWLEDNGVIEKAQHAQYAAIPVYTTQLEQAVRDADFILENGPENLAIKQSILAEIEACCPEQAVISSSTSAIMIREIAQYAKRPQRVIGAHPYLPVYLLPLVEIVTDEAVEETYLEELKDFLVSVGKKPVVLRKDCPGYIGTRLMNTICREAISMLLDGVCSVEDLDTAFTFGPGLRYALLGPFMVYQLTGGDLGIRGLFGGHMYGRGPEEKPAEKKTVMQTLCNWREYPPEAKAYMNGALPEEVDRMMQARGITNEDLMEFRDKGLLELLRYHQLL